MESLDTDQSYRDPSTDRIPIDAEFVAIVRLAGKIWRFDPFDFSPAAEASEALSQISLTQMHLSQPPRAIELKISSAELRDCSVAVAWVSAKLHRIIAAASAHAFERQLYETDLYEYRRVRPDRMKDEPLICKDISPETIFRPARAPSARPPRK